MRTLWILVIASTLLKLLLLGPAAGLPLRGDEIQYVKGAQAIAATGLPDYPNPVWDEAHASPIYPYALAALHRLFGLRGLVQAMRVIQIVLSAMTVLLVYLVARRALDHRSAIVSAAVTAFFPTFIAYTHYMYTETLFTFLFVAVAAILSAGNAPPGPGRVLAAGVAAGLAALTRGAFVVMAPVVVLWLLLDRESPPARRAKLAGLFALGMLLVVLPWSVRNTVRYERFLLIDTNAGNVLYKNWNAIRQENHDVGMDKRWKVDRDAYDGAIPFRERVDEVNIVDRNNAETRAALGFVLSHPLLHARLSMIRAAELVNPTSFLVRGLRRGDYGTLPWIVTEAIVWTVLLSTMGVLAFGFIGLAARPPNRAWLLAALLVLANTAICILIVSMSRYRFPMMPLLIPFAVGALLRGKELGAFFRSPPGWIVGVAVLLPMLIAWIVYLPLSL